MSTQLLDTQIVVNGLFHSVKDGLLIYTEHSTDQVFVNNSFCTMLGYTCQLFHDGNHVGVLPPDLLQQVREDIPSLFALPNLAEQKSLVISLTRKNAQNIKVAIEHGVFQGEKDLLHIFILRDITWLALLEKRKNEAERILRHDIKNYASNFEQLAAHIIAKSDNANVTQAAELIKEAGSKLNELLDTDLDNFMLETGKFQLSRSDCNLNKMLSGIAAQYSFSSRSRGIQLSYQHEELNNGYDIYYEGDCLLLERLFQNLIKNAVEASPDGKKVEVAVEEQAGFVLFSVHNMGVIPEEFRSRFMHDHATSKQNGHGLGAYTARLIAEAHGGRIDFESSEESGTTLRVTLPRPHTES